MSAIRNLLFDSEHHLFFIFEVNVVPHILIPLLVNTPLTDQEKDGMDPEVIKQV